MPVRYGSQPCAMILWFERSNLSPTLILGSNTLRGLPGRHCRFGLAMGRGREGTGNYGKYLSRLRKIRTAAKQALRTSRRVRTAAGWSRDLAKRVDNGSPETVSVVSHSASSGPQSA